MPIPPPTVQAFLVCERCIQDSAAKNYSIIGVIGALALSSLPETVEQIWCYVALTGVRSGRLRLELAYIDQEDAPLWHTECDQASPYPIVLSQSRFLIGNIPIDREMDLSVRLLWDGELLSSFRLFVYPPGASLKPQ